MHWVTKTACEIASPDDQAACRLRCRCCWPDWLVLPSCAGNKAILRSSGPGAKRPPAEPEARCANTQHRRSNGGTTARATSWAQSRSRFHSPLRLGNKAVGKRGVVAPVALPGWPRAFSNASTSDIRRPPVRHHPLTHLVICVHGPGLDGRRSLWQKLELGNWVGVSGPKANIKNHPGAQTTAQP